MEKTTKVLASKDGKILKCELETKELLEGFDFCEELDGKIINLIAKNGKCISFKESDLRTMGKKAGGVMGMRLAEDNEIKALRITNKPISGKITGRGGQGQYMKKDNIILLLDSLKIL